MNQNAECRMPDDRAAAAPLHEQLMRRHLREENRTQAVMPACPINRVLAGQKALVTGANSGIGQAVALAQAGADVVIDYVTHPEAAAEEAAGHGVKAYAHEADISREDQVQAMFRRMLQELGAIDILVHRRAERHRTRRHLAGIGLFGLHPRREHIRGRRHDAVSRVRDRRLICAHEFGKETSS